MKKANKMANGVKLNEMGYLVNEEGKRVNYDGEELIEVDAEAFMKAMEAKMFSAIAFTVSGFFTFILFMIVINNPESPVTPYESLLYLGIIGMFAGLGALFKHISNWKNKPYKAPKFVVNLPKSTIDRFKSTDTILDTVASENTSLDQDGDGRVLISEVYTLSEEEVISNIKKVDTDFSALDFKDYVKSVFVLVQQGWSNNDYRSLRPYESDLLYFRHKHRIESMVNDEISNKRSHIRVKGALLKDYKVEDEQEVLVVTITANMKVENSEDMYMTEEGDFPYVLKFVRKKGVKTNKKRHLSTGNCCNCGAVIDVDDDGICKYCETSVVSGDADWILTDIKNIKIQGI